MIMKEGSPLSQRWEEKFDAFVLQNMVDKKKKKKDILYVDM